MPLETFLKMRMRSWLVPPEESGPALSTQLPRGWVFPVPQAGKMGRLTQLWIMLHPHLLNFFFFSQFENPQG